ncbi:MAG: ATP-binding protein [Chloroflexota bacterium]
MVTITKEGVRRAIWRRRHRPLSRYMGKKRSLTVRGRYDKIRNICEFVADGAQRAGFDKDAVFQVQLACDEACTNIIEHTYQEEDAGDITISWEIKRGVFVVTIRDDGERFDPGDIPPAPIPPTPITTGEDEDFDIKVGGLGVYFMRSLMDKVDFSFKEGNGNILRMEKQLPKESDS